MKVGRLAVVMAVLLVAAGTAWATTFTSATSYSWNCGAYGGSAPLPRLATWGAGIPATPGGLNGAGVNFPWTGDTAWIQTGHTVVVGEYLGSGWEGLGNGVAMPSTLTIVLNGGTFFPLDVGSVSSSIQVNAASNLQINEGGTPNYEPYITGGTISDYDAEHTGKITLTGTAGAMFSLTKDSRNFSGGWNVGNKNVYFGYYFGGSLPAPSVGASLMGTGAIEMNGGSLNFWSYSGNVGTGTPMPNSIVLTGTGSLIQRENYAVYHSGHISGAGLLVVHTVTSGGSITLSNAGNSYGDLTKGGAGTAIMKDPGCFGNGTITVSGGLLKLDNAGGAEWDLTGNDLVIDGGKVQYDTAVEDVFVSSLTLGANPTYTSGEYDITQTYAGVMFPSYFAGTGQPETQYITIRAAGAIPEPAGLGLVGMAFLALRRRRRRGTGFFSERRSKMFRKMLVGLMVGTLVLAVAGSATADDFFSQSGGDWNTRATMHYGDNTNYNVWGQGIAPTGHVAPAPTPVEAGVYFPWSGDTGTINAGHFVKVHTYYNWGGTGANMPSGLTVILNGGTLSWAAESANSPVYSPIKVEADSYIAGTAGIRGNISDYVADDPQTPENETVTGKITITNATSGLFFNTTDNSGFSGGWDMTNSYLRVGWVGAAFGQGNQVFGTGPVEANGASIQFHNNTGTMNNAFILGASGLAVTTGGSGGGAGTAAFGGIISGPGTLTLNVASNTITVTNASNTYGNLDKTGGGVATIQKLGGLGTNTNAYTVRVTSGILALDDPDATPNAWTVQKNLAGIGTIQVEGGSGQLIASGNAVRPGNVAGTPGTLTIGGNFAFAKSPAGANGSFDVEVLGVWTDDDGDAQTPDVLTDINCDLLAVTHDVTGMDNADLNVTVDPLLTLDDLMTYGGGEDTNEYTILTCANDLTAAPQFNPGTWTGEPGSPEYRGGSGSVVIVFTSGAPIPEPAGLGLLGLALLALRKRRS